jgi:hypothetical protein
VPPSVIKRSFASFSNLAPKFETLFEIKFCLSDKTLAFGHQTKPKVEHKSKVEHSSKVCALHKPGFLSYQQGW